MRFYLYFTFGVVSSLLGWFTSQMLLLGTGESITKGPLGTFSWLANSPELLMLPIIAAFLGVAMVVTEIFLSNPTRYKANRRVLPRYLQRALLIGTIAGLIAALLTMFISRQGVDAIYVRVAAWSLIGLLTGLGEGWSWRSRSIEASTKKANQRVLKSALYGLAAGIIAAIAIETMFPETGNLAAYKEPMGFVILGLSIGGLLSFATSPSYQVALRAGQGFEAVDPDVAGEITLLPKICNPSLNFVSDDEAEIIEEGLSIQIPSQYNKSITIGSDSNVDIFLPHTHPNTAVLLIDKHDVKLKCVVDNAVQIQSRRISRNRKGITLRHNQIITFFHSDDDSKFYRFVFYDRFLDPLA